MDESKGFTRAEINFASEAARLREEQHWTLAELAERLERAGAPAMSVMTVSRVEKAQRHVSMVEAHAYAQVFEVSLSAMMWPSAREAKLQHFVRSAAHAERAWINMLDAAKNFYASRRAIRPHPEQVRELYSGEEDPETRRYVDFYLKDVEYLLSRDAHEQLRKIEARIENE